MPYTFSLSHSVCMPLLADKVRLTSISKPKGRPLTDARPIEEAQSAIELPCATPVPAPMLMDDARASWMHRILDSAPPAPPCFDAAVLAHVEVLKQVAPLPVDIG